MTTMLFFAVLLGEVKGHTNTTRFFGPLGLGLSLLGLLLLGLGLGLLLLGLSLLGLLGDDTIITINRKKTLERENKEERPIVQTLSLSLNAFKTQQKKIKFKSFKNIQYPNKFSD